MCLGLFLGDDGVIGSDFSFIVEEEGGELMGAFGEAGGEGDVGLFFSDGFCFEIFSVEAEGSCGDGEGESFVGAEGFVCSGDVFSGGKAGGDGVVCFGCPAVDRDVVGAVFDDFDGPVPLMLFLGEGFIFIVGVTSADVALVPGRSGVEPVVSGEGGGEGFGMADVDFGGLSEGWVDFGPPGLVKRAHFLHLIGFVFCDVLFLTGVFGDVVKFLTIDEAVLLRHDGGLPPFDGVNDTLGIGDEKSFWPCDIGRGVDEILQREAVEFDFGFVGDSASFEEGRDNIDGVAEGGDFAMGIESCGGPVNEHGDTVATVIGGAFVAPHACIEDSGAGGGAVVGGEDEDGVVGDTKVGDELAGGTDVVIDVGDHAKEGRDSWILVFVEIEILLRAVKRAVRRIGRDVGKEGLLFGGGFLNEVVGGVEEDIGAKAFCRNDLAVVEVVAIEIGVVP